jgi:hypothetical protein
MLYFLILCPLYVATIILRDLILVSMGAMIIFIVKFWECCNITVADNPGDTYTCATINGFDNSLFSFFYKGNATFHQIPLL